MKHYKLQSVREVEKHLSEHPDYDIFLQCGFSWKGAGEHKMTDESELPKFLDWFCACDVDVDDDKKELHLNGFSVCDME